MERIDAMTEVPIAGVQIGRHGELSAQAKDIGLLAGVWPRRLLLAGVTFVYVRAQFDQADTLSVLYVNDCGGIFTIFA